MRVERGEIAVGGGEDRGAERDAGAEEIGPCLGVITIVEAEPREGREPLVELGLERVGGDAPVIDVEAIGAVEGAAPGEILRDPGHEGVPAALGGELLELKGTLRGGDDVPPVAELPFLEGESIVEVSDGGRREELRYPGVEVERAPRVVAVVGAVDEVSVEPVEDHVEAGRDDGVVLGEGAARREAAVPRAVVLLVVEAVADRRGVAVLGVGGCPVERGGLVAARGVADEVDRVGGGRGDDVDGDPDAVGEVRALLGDDLELRLLDAHLFRAGLARLSGARLVARPALIEARVAEGDRLDVKEGAGFGEDVGVVEERRARLGLLRGGGAGAEERRQREREEGSAARPRLH